MVSASANAPQGGSRFLTGPQRSQIMQAIAEAEKATSGEIRVHIESGTGKDPYERAKDVFTRLKMHRTALRNGVLIYVATRDRKFAILGDAGINGAVPEGFWAETRDIMASHFVKGEFCDGICQGLAIAGDALGKYFPYQGAKDVNELSDEISEGK